MDDAANLFEQSQGMGLKKPRLRGAGGAESLM